MYPSSAPRWWKESPHSAGLARLVAGLTGAPVCGPRVPTPDRPVVRSDVYKDIVGRPSTSRRSLLATCFSPRHTCLKECVHSGVRATYTVFDWVAPFDCGTSEYISLGGVLAVDIISVPVKPLSLKGWHLRMVPPEGATVLRRLPSMFAGRLLPGKHRDATRILLVTSYSTWRQSGSTVLHSWSPFFTEKTAKTVAPDSFERVAATPSRGSETTKALGNHVPVFCSSQRSRRVLKQLHAESNTLSAPASSSTSQFSRYATTRTKRATDRLLCSMRNSGAGFLHCCHQASMGTEQKRGPTGCICA